MNPTWVYHPNHEARIVSESEANILYREGWFDTPSKFQKAENAIRETPQESNSQKKRRKPQKPAAEG